MKRLLVVLIAQLAMVGGYCQRVPVRVKVDLNSAPVLYTGYPVEAVLTVSPGPVEGDSATVNSLLFKNSIKGAAYRFSVAKTRTRGNTTLDLGQTDMPGPYFMEIDTVNNSVKGRGRPDRLYGRYSAFLHPADEGDCNCDNSKRLYPIVRETLNSFPSTEWVLLDSLITRIDVDSVNNRWDARLAGANDTTTCKPNGAFWKMAFVITCSPAETDTMALVSVVIDTLRMAARFNEKEMIDSCITVVSRELLDSSDQAVERFAIANSTKKTIADRLVLLKDDTTKFRRYYSAGFVRQGVMVSRRLDVDFNCRRICVYRTMGPFNQLVVLLKIRAPSP